MTVPKSELEQALRQKRNLSQSTLKTYVSLLTSLTKHLELSKVDELTKDDSKIIEYVKALDKPQTRKTILSALYVITELPLYKENMIGDVKLVNEQYKTQKTDDNRKANLISFDKVQEIVESLYKKMKSNPTHENIVNYLTAVICSGYYGEALPPRRLEICDMKIRNFDKEKDNYVDKGKFFYNQYKTANKYGQQVVSIPKDLNLLINKWKKNNDKDYLLVDENGDKYTAPKLSKKIKTLFEGNSQDVLRSIFLSNYYKDLPKLETLNKLASDMGNTLNSQLNYYVKKD